MFLRYQPAAGGPEDLRVPPMGTTITSVQLHSQYVPHGYIKRDTFQYSCKCKPIFTYNPVRVCHEHYLTHQHSEAPPIPIDSPKGVLLAFSLAAGAFQEEKKNIVTDVGHLGWV